ncbi:MAG: hypothetical protein ACFFAO_21995, partial [Candidatus Hermodarchaeota archaeon]
SNINFLSNLGKMEVLQLSYNAISDICENKNIKKAKLIRDYLELIKYLRVTNNDIRSLNENNLIILKRDFFTDIIKDMDEIKQIELGTRLARFINDIARIQKKEDINFRLDLCHYYGLFNKFIDADNYILFSKKFGPRRYVEAFAWQLITKGDKGDFDKSFIESEMEDNKKLRTKYQETIQPVRRDASYYGFEFAKL